MKKKKRKEKKIYGMILVIVGYLAHLVGI